MQCLDQLVATLLVAAKVAGGFHYSRCSTTKHRYLYSCNKIGVATARVEVAKHVGPEQIRSTLVRSKVIELEQSPFFLFAKVLNEQANEVES